MNFPSQKTLPSREIAYNYCGALYLAQQLEENLRYFLDSADNYGLIEEIQLTKRESEKYVKCEDPVVAFIDNEMCGRLLQVLKNRIRLPRIHWKELESAIKDRNFLAHKFLIQFDCESLSKKDGRKIIDVIRTQFLRLYKGLIITRALRKSLDEKTDKIDSSIDELFDTKQSHKKSRRSR